MTDRRNPYFILGLDYGADPGQVATAAARAIRRLSRAEDPPYRREDVTDAMHKLEQPETDPDAQLGTFRAPANPAAYGYPAASGVLSPAPENLPRTTGASDAEVQRLQATVVTDRGGEALAALADTLFPSAPREDLSLTERIPVRGMDVRYADLSNLADLIAAQAGPARVTARSRRGDVLSDGPFQRFRPNPAWFSVQNPALELAEIRMQAPGVLVVLGKDSRIEVAAGLAGLGTALAAHLSRQRIPAGCAVGCLAVAVAPALVAAAFFRSPAGLGIGGAAAGLLVLLVVAAIVYPRWSTKVNLSPLREGGR